MTLFSRSSFIVLALLAAATVIPQSFPLSSMSMASELLVIANDQVTCSLCGNCDNPCPPLLPPPQPPPPIIECPPPLQPPPPLSPSPPPPPFIECPPPPPPPSQPPPPPPLPAPLSPPPPASPPLPPPPLTENCPLPPVPPTGDIGQRTPPLPPPALPPPTTCAMCEWPSSGGIIYGFPPPPTVYSGYGGRGDGFYPPRPNIMTPYFPYDGLPPHTASTGRCAPLFLYFRMAVLLALHYIM